MRALRPRLFAAAAAFAALLALTAKPTPAPDASAGQPEAVRAGYDKAATELLCYCGCARQTIKECTCGVAFGLRDEFEKRLASGETADAIIASYIAEHGEQSRNVPPKSGINLVAWFGPGIAIILAGAGVLIVLSIWAKRGRAAAAAAGAAAAAQPAPAEGSEEARANDEMRRRIEKDLEEFDA
jgi:cytochrome c-type biogenesis protein CcmH/NrfF